MLEVYKDRKYGEDVFVSKSAEEGRKNGCLCINGCLRFKNNIWWQNNRLRMAAGFMSDDTEQFEEFKKSSEGKALLKRIILEAAGRWLSLMEEERKAKLQGMDENIHCDIALANFAVCLAGGVANGISRCPYFLPDEEKVKIIDKPT